MFKKYLSKILKRKAVTHGNANAELTVIRTKTKECKKNNENI